MKRLLILTLVLASCNCDEYYKRDENIPSKLADYKTAYEVISKNYEFLKSKGLSFKSGSPGLEGISIDCKKLNQLTVTNNDHILTSLKGLWDNKLIEENGKIKYYLTDKLPSIDFCVKKCRGIEHIIYFGEQDMYDHRGQSDDFSTFHVDSLDGHWRYVIQQVNSGQ